MDNISLVTYAGQTVTPLDDALVYETAINQSGMIYGGIVTIKSANNLHISSGHGIVCGRKFTIFDSDIQVALSSSGTLLGRLYVQLDLSNVGTPIQLLVETGASLTPVQQDNNVNIMNGVFEFNIATFTVDTSTISNVIMVAPSAEPSTGAGSVITVTTSEASLAGKMCTITDGTTTLNANFDNTGKAVFYGVQMVGRVLVNATDGEYYASGEVNITYFGLYSTSIAFWGATINLSTTTPEFYGQNITVEQDGILVSTISFDGTGHATYIAPALGVYDFTVTYGGNEYTATVNVTEETTYNATIDTTPPVETYTVTVDIYSAASDTISYTDDNGAQTVTTDATGKATGVSITITQPSVGVDPTITFTSSVAKDPDNLSNSYSKSVTVTSQTTTIYVMPDEVIYWWGWKISTTSNPNSGHPSYSNAGNALSFGTNSATASAPGSTSQSKYTVFDTALDITGMSKCEVISGSSPQRNQYNSTGTGNMYIGVQGSHSSSSTAIRIAERNDPASTDMAKDISISSGSSLVIYAIWFD
jgi:hypothetical protein